MNRTFILLALIFTLALAAIWARRLPSEENVGDGSVPAANEIVMTPGMRITATTPVGTIRITAGKGLKRSYTWEGATRSVEMWPRRDRWYGSLGLYFPGPGYHWEEQNGIARACTQEGHQYFQSEEEAIQWIRRRNWMQYTYRGDGLAVGWLKVPACKRLDVEVWQIYVDRQKPAALPGYNEDSIVVNLPETETLQ